MQSIRKTYEYKYNLLKMLYLFYYPTQKVETHDMLRVVVYELLQFLHIAHNMNPKNAPLYDIFCFMFIWCHFIIIKI